MIPEVLRHRAYWVSAALLGSIGLVSAVSLLTNPTYESSMQILLEPNAGKPTILNATSENSPPSEANTNIAALTEIRLMRSNQFVEQAIESLEREQPDLCQDKAARADCIQDFKDRLTITQLKEGKIKTRVVEVVFTGTRKDETFKFLLALQKLYRIYNVKQQQERIDDRLAIFDYQLSTGEKSLSQSPENPQTSDKENSSALSREALFAIASGKQKEFYPESPDEKKIDQVEIDQAEIYGKETHSESEKVAAIQLIHLRQEMANNLIQSGFTWEVVEYPMTGRRVFPWPWSSLTIGLLFNVFWVVFKEII